MLLTKLYCDVSVFVMESVQERFEVNMMCLYYFFILDEAKRLVFRSQEHQVVSECASFSLYQDRQGRRWSEEG